MSNIEARIQELGITIPDITVPLANYIPAKRSGNLVYTSGHICALGDQSFKGKIGRDIDTEKGKEAAKIAVINCLGAVKNLMGNLDCIKQVIAVHGLVNSDPEFTEQGVVMNGASDLMVALFGEAGKHTRTAAGIASLPFDFSISIYIIVEVE
jgi:enamine deaminase RidA (YjgF/YER057c/UK114 family)